MTRINVVPVAELCDQHLMVEWRELTRIPNGIAAGKFSMDNIPDTYTVRTENNPEGGRGHMKFFFNKLLFLYQRYKSILDELKNRGYPQTSNWPYVMAISASLYGSYNPTKDALALNRTRIQERVTKNPRYAGEYL